MAEEAPDGGLVDLTDCRIAPVFVPLPTFLPEQEDHMTIDLDALSESAPARGNAREIIDTLMDEVRELRGKLAVKSEGGLAEDLIRRTGRPDLVRPLDG